MAESKREQKPDFVVDHWRWIFFGVVVLGVILVAALAG